MEGLSPGLYGIGLGLLGVQCVLFVVFLCSKTKKASFKVEQSSKDSKSSAPLISNSNNPVETVQVIVEGGTKNGEEEKGKSTTGREEPAVDNGNQSNDPQSAEMAQDAQNEQTYEEIDIECQPYGSYSTIQEVAKSGGRNADGCTAERNDCDPYSIIDNVQGPSGEVDVNPYYNLKETLPSVLKTNQADNASIRDGEPNQSANGSDPIDAESVSQLYSKVVKRPKNDVTNEIDSNDRFKGEQNVEESKIYLRNSHLGHEYSKYSNISRGAFDGLYSEVNKKRKTIAVLQDACLNGEMSCEVPKKFSSGNIHFERGGFSREMRSVDAREDEGSHPYDEIDIRPEEQPTQPIL